MHKKTRGPWTLLLLLVKNFTFGVENSDREDIIAQGFFCMRSLFGSTQLELWCY